MKTSTIPGRFSQISFLSIFVLLVLSSCTSADQDPTQFSVETVTIEAPPAEQAFIPQLDGPLRPISASPSGTLVELQPGQTVSVTFSQPMVPLGETPPISPEQFTLDPPVAGSLRWEGTQTLVFEPLNELPYATAFSATLQAGLTAIDGSRMDEPYSWQFETPRPRLLHSSPRNGDNYIHPEGGIFLTYNQDLDASQLAGHFSLVETQSGNAVVLDLTMDEAHIVRMQPAQPLEQGVWYSVRIPRGVTGTAGPLGSDRDVDFSFRVYPELRFERVTQTYQGTEISDQLDPASGITLHFSTRVSFGDVLDGLTITPEVNIPAGLEANDYPSETHWLPVLWRPETTYTIRIDSLEDVHEQFLESASHRFTTRPYTPSVRIPSGLVVIEADEQPVLPMHVVNVDNIAYGIERVDKEGLIARLPSYDRWYHNYQLKIPRIQAIEATQSEPLDIERNVPEVKPFDLRRTLPDSTGIAVVRLNRPPGHPNKNPYLTLAQVTRLGISAKFSPHQNLIFVTELATAAPVAGASVEVRGRDNNVYWTGTTDENGQALTPGWYALGMPQDHVWDSPAQFVFVEHGNDLAFTSSLYDNGLEPYRFGIGYDWEYGMEDYDWYYSSYYDESRPVDYKGLIFSDRGLYREGELVELKGMIRSKTDGEWQPVVDSVEVIITSPDNEEVLKARFLTSAMGTFDFTWQSPEAATLGSYYVSVTRTDEDRTNLTSGDFRVDAFRRATFSVDVNASAPAYLAGDFFEGTIAGHYLFGAAMQEQPVRYTLRTQATRYSPPGYDGFTFSSWRNAYGANRQIASNDTLLDNEGQHGVRARLLGNESGMPAKVILNASVTDPARQQSSGQTETLLHPGLFYIGLKQQTTFLDINREKAMTIDVITVDPAGQPVAAENIDITLVREQWNSVRELGTDGRLRWRSERIEEEKHAQKIGTEPGKARRLNLPITEGGSYYLRAETRDARGNRIRSEAHFYATGAGYVAWRRNDDDRIELIPEKTTYAPGETARLLVQSPYEKATALITVEREGIISSTVTTLVGSAPQIEIPIEERHMPNVYVSVMLLTGRSGPPEGANDPGAPAFKMGYASLRVDPGERHLRVEIIPNEETYRPGDEATVDLRLVDADGRGVAGEIVFSAADAGVLNLVNYALPDPFEAFYGRRALGVTTSQTLANLVKQRNFGQKEEDEGGGGGDESNDGVRKDFRPSAYWNPAIQTDERGRASVSFKLPESLTTFRFMASALTENNLFGAGHTDVIVTKPLVLKQALPRFARLDDSFEAGVLITNTTGNAGDATVTVSAEGLALTGENSQTLRLENGQTREVRFAWKTQTAGDATLRFNAMLGRESDAFEITLPTMLPTIKATQATFASTESSAGEALLLPGNILPQFGKFEAQLSSTALVGLDGAARYLIDYPYGCLEQQTSRIRPMIAGDAVLDVFGIETLKKSRDEYIRDWIGMLRSYWIGNGFSLWRGGHIVNEYVTTYVVLGLAEARDAGFAIPEHLTSDGVDAVERFVKSSNAKPDYFGQRTWNDTRAFMLYALSRHDRFLDQEINALLSNVLSNNQPISVDGRSHLLRTLIRRKNPAFDGLQQRLAESLVQLLRVESTSAYLTASQDPDARWIFASDTRSTAFGLSALMETNPPAETRRLVELMIRYLIDTRHGAHWASTQENAAVMEAFSLYQQEYEAAEPDFSAAVSVAGNTILREAFQGRSLDTRDEEISLTGLPTGETLPVEISKEGEGRLYYTIRLETYSTDPVEALAQGLGIERTVERIDESGVIRGVVERTPLGVMNLTAGELVRVTLRLTSPADRNYVVVDDPLPAGLEAVNAAFATTDPMVARNTGGNRWWGSFNHTELRDDRVLLFADYLTRGEHTYTYIARATTPGAFVHPPAQTELMYDPEINGRNASGTLVVTAPGPASAQR